MDYLLCIPARETNTRENCEKIHNVLARMSDTYKLRIVPEPVTGAVARAANVGVIIERGNNLKENN